ncbi:TonB-dependent receptor plug domain-containing protein [Flexithrix dorotheae]|uniref:TonB-dependent receptor plug domain-containing protein n=1 Tax=Flexithrix dorotheae TaxID=70993 RepID=UPI000370A5BB|nr:TonB-dependent receptor [Flexithrix dorotheae]
MRRYFTIVLLIQLNFAFSQNFQESKKEVPTYQIDVNELLEIPRKTNYDQEIVSASKKAESLFEAPLSASVLTKEEIKASGVTNVMEAMRLVPGVIVRQMTNGVYNIQIRGMDWLPKHGTEGALNGLNKLSLVMIDGRPVYNYLQGNTFWEAFPIGLNDIERIEVVRGPAASMFGPNAVTGVINIITNKTKKDGLFANANVQMGSFNSTIANMAVGYQANEKFSVIVSGNREYRERTHDLYFSRGDSQYVAANELNYFSGIISSQQGADQIFQNSHVSLDKKGVNAFMEYKPVKAVSFSLKSGYENTFSNKVIYPNFSTPITKMSSESWYMDTETRIFNGRIKASYQKGTQDPIKGIIYTYDFDFLDLDVEYPVQVLKNLTLTPSFSYRLAQYSHDVDDSRILDSFDKTVNAVTGNLDPSLPFESGLELAMARTFVPPFSIISPGSKIDNPAFALRGDYRLLNDKLRFVSSIRADQFSNLNKDIFYSYHFSSTFKLNTNVILRANVAKANSSQSIIDSQVNLVEPTSVDIGGGNYVPAFNITSGNKDLVPISQTIFEVGARAKIKEKLSLDLEIFRGLLSNHRASIKEDIVLDLSYSVPFAAVNQKFRSLPMTAEQIGTTFSLTYTGKNFWLRPFATFQKTTINDYSPYFSTQAYQSFFADKPQDTHFENTEDNENLATPGWFGGFYLNYRPMKNLSVNLNAYFMGNQSYEPNGIRNQYETGDRIVLNAKVAYDINRQVSFFASVRDLSNSDLPEYYNTDPIKQAYYFGLNFELK